MHTVKAFKTQEQAEAYITENNLKSGKAIAYKADRSDPKWTHTAYKVTVSHQEYIEHYGKLWQ